MQTSLALVKYTKTEEQGTLGNSVGNSDFAKLWLFADASIFQCMQKDPEEKPAKSGYLHPMRPLPTLQHNTD